MDYTTTTKRLLPSGGGNSIVDYTTTTKRLLPSGGGENNDFFFM